MKQMLLLVTAMLLVAGMAVADHIGIYSDATAVTCSLFPGFSTTATVVHRFSAGSTGSAFDISVANAPGSSLLSFNSGYMTLCVNPPCPFLYGGCLQGDIVVGTLIGIYAPPGYLEVVGAHGSPTPLVADCAAEQHSATGGRASIGTTGDCEPLATESSTWGKVKSLYR